MTGGAKRQNAGPVGKGRNRPCRAGSDGNARIGPAGGAKRQNAGPVGKGRNRPFRAGSDGNARIGPVGGAKRQNVGPVGKGRNRPFRAGSDDNARIGPAFARKRRADATVKLQKFLSSVGAASRRGAEDLVRAGRVTVDGERAEIGVRVTATQRIALDGKILSVPARQRVRLLAYHKPRGQIVSRSGERTVFEELPSIPQGRWLNIGRLDVATEGLLLFANDGDLCNRLAHPSGGCLREYIVLSPDLIDAHVISGALSDGVSSDGARTRPLEFAKVGSSEKGPFCYRIALANGRNRSVRRIIAACGANISRLVRFRFGPYYLSADVKPGSWREVSRTAQPDPGARQSALGCVAELLCCKIKPL